MLLSQTKKITIIIKRVGGNSWWWWISIYLPTHQVIYVKYMEHFLYQSHLNKVLLKVFLKLPFFFTMAGNITIIEFKIYFKFKINTPLGINETGLFLILTPLCEEISWLLPKRKSSLRRIHVRIRQRYQA